ncbi:MAG: N-acetyltransferase [Thermodesulfovibrionales bacterium]|nr:N-acetyltransferase [Thermodesulfovibrionales bacterium]
MRIRKAKINDVKSIQVLINEYARKEEMLPRALNDLYESIRDFFVADEEGVVIGTCALRILWEDLAEIRSLAVKDGFQGKGIGSKLVKACLKEAHDLGIKRVFALTYQREFFKKIGFKDISKRKLPQKIWGDCLRCPKFPDCDEHAVILNLKRFKGKTT